MTETQKDFLRLLLWLVPGEVIPRETLHHVIELLADFDARISAIEACLRAMEPPVQEERARDG